MPIALCRNDPHNINSQKGRVQNISILAILSTNNEKRPFRIFWRISSLEILNLLAGLVGEIGIWTLEVGCPEITKMVLSGSKRQKKKRKKNVVGNKMCPSKK